MQQYVHCKPGLTVIGVCAPSKTQQHSVALRNNAALQALRDGVQDVAVKVLAASQLSGIAEGIQLQILKKVWSAQPSPPQPDPTPYQPQPIPPFPLSSPPPAHLPVAHSRAFASLHLTMFASLQFKTLFVCILHRVYTLATTTIVTASVMAGDPPDAQAVL